MELPESTGCGQADYWTAQQRIVGTMVASASSTIASIFVAVLLWSGAVGQGPCGDAGVCNGSFGRALLVADRAVGPVKPSRHSTRPLYKSARHSSRPTRQYAQPARQYYQ